MNDSKPSSTVKAMPALSLNWCLVQHVFMCFSTHWLCWLVRTQGSGCHWPLIYSLVKWFSLICKHCCWLCLIRSHFSSAMMWHMDIDCMIWYYFILSFILVCIATSLIKLVSISVTLGRLNLRQPMRKCVLCIRSHVCNLRTSQIIHVYFLNNCANKDFTEWAMLL